MSHRWESRGNICSDVMYTTIIYAYLTYLKYYKVNIENNMCIHEGKPNFLKFIFKIYIGILK